MAWLRSRAASRAVRATAGRLSWGLGDQAISSLTNFVVGMYVARTLGVTGFGVFTLAWVTYGLVLNVSRGVTTDPLMVRFSGVDLSHWRRATGRASAAALVVGSTAGVFSCTLGAITLAITDSPTGTSIGWAFLALGAALPALLLQDCWRFAFFAAGEGRRAFVNDLVRAGALVPALLFATRLASVPAFVLAWGASAAVAAIHGLVRTRLAPRPNRALAWLREHRDLGARYLVENVSNSGASQLRMYGVGAIAGLAAVGAIRGAELLLGPFLAVLMGLSMVTVSEAARVLRRDPHRLWPFCGLIGGVQALAALAWGLALITLIPESLGSWLLGSVWDPASALVLPVTLSVTAAGVVAGATAGLRALGSARRSLRAQLFGSITYLGAGLSGAAIAGASGAVWGSALAMWCAAVVWWLQLRTALAGNSAPATTELSETGSENERTRTS